jgi:hypothetical protein
MVRVGCIGAALSGTLRDIGQSISHVANQGWPPRLVRAEQIHIVGVPR